MFQFTLNGKNVQTANDSSLITYLRETARLTSVKNGCGEGSCGACTVLLDGKAVRACTLTVARVDGRSITTAEGLSEREKTVYTWAFTTAGAVQCGFCTPGMVMSAKGLLDRTLCPTPGEVKSALRNNICRCTGYVKIEQAVMLAAKAFRGETGPILSASAGIGSSLSRLDAPEKIWGTAIYCDDLFVAGMLQAAVLRTQYPRAIVKMIDTSPALSTPGVVAVLTAEDIPGSRYWGFIVKDWPALVAVGEMTRYAGDALALVAAKTKEAAQAAVKAIRVEYEVLEPLTSPQMALNSGAASIHPNGDLLSQTTIKRGDAAAALKQSAYSITRMYTTPMTEHAFLEPESALAMPDEQDGILIYSGSQSVYEDQHGIASILGLPPERVRVSGKLIGGAFGGKEDLSVQHHAALLAWHTQRPVKLTLSRQESILVHPKRHPMEIEITTACDEQGMLTAVAAKVVADTGAYASLGMQVLQRACTHLAGPYQVPNVDITGFCVYTNNPPAGAFRGFGVPQAAFACEGNLDALAEKVGIDPWEIRYRNALEPGMTMPTGQVADAGTAIKETLLAVKDAYLSAEYAGIACALKNTGLGVGVPDIGRVTIRAAAGRLQILTSAACLGQGLATILVQIVGEVTALSPQVMDVLPPDTSLTPDSGTTTASRQTLFTGEAARQAARQLAQDLAESPLLALEGREYHGEYYGRTDPLSSNAVSPVHHVAFSYATQIVVLDRSGKITKVIAAHDVGKAINPLAIEGQVEGAIAMGLGYALREDFPLANAVPAVNFGRLGLFRTTEMPDIQVIIIEKNPVAVAFGAKGVGEIATIPTAPAVASAYYRYDHRIRTSLPLQNTPYRKH